MRLRTAPPVLTLDDVRAKVIVTPSGCWEWQGNRDLDGYGRVNYRLAGRMGSLKAHRIMLALTLGRPLVLDALHTCDNPPCCAPDHLYEGDKAQNTRDRQERGRHWARAGVECGQSNLTEADVRQIRVAVLTERQCDVAACFGTSQAAISRLVNHRTYTGVGP